MNRLGYEETRRPPRRLTNGSCINVLHWHFIVAINFSDRRDINSDHAAPPELYRGDLPHNNWTSRRVSPVRSPFGYPQIRKASNLSAEGVATKIKSSLRDGAIALDDGIPTRLR
jgi:hypothetical protein